jgi:glucosamine--fructose-6-phosphate aminotransferase (isomerizing)
MCGIVGFAGKRQAAPILLDGLSKLEYRGYDSAGLAVRDGEKPAEVVKAVGRLKNLAEKTDDGKALPGTCGIGHTRWATHGEPSQTNAHPHVSGNCTGSGSGKVESEVVGVHNGIIENYKELKEKLLRHDYRFYSDTDTEVAVKLVDYYYKKYIQTPVDAIMKTMVRVRGSYALELMFNDHPGEIWVARKDSPMIIGIADGETYVASDVPAILKYTRTVYYIGNLQCAKITPGEVHFYDLNGDEIEIQPVEIKWDAEAAEKGGYEHFMIKEIHEQPKAVGDTLNSVLKDDRIDLSEIGLDDETIRDITSVTMVACGSAWHVGMALQYVIEDLTRLPVRVELASEFRYRNPILDPKQLVVVISQSGETADTREALRLAKNHGIRTLAVVNVVGSSIAREADNVFYTLAGPEIAVATTKAYSAQLMAGYTLAVQFAKARGTITEEDYAKYIGELRSIPAKITKILEDKERIQWFASKFAHIRDAFFIGRGIDYAVCLEGSLKMKEISYVHSEAYAAGELKHGTISLVEDGVPVIGVLTQKSLVEKTIGNMRECKARGAYLVGIAAEDDGIAGEETDCLITVPGTDPHFMGSLAVVPLQLLGYYTSVARGLDVDKPRNLAKSVTVE